MEIVRVLVLFALGVSPLMGAIFANDAIYLSYAGQRIADNRVLVVTANKEIYLCKKGSFWLRQGPEWSAGPYTFYRSHHELLTFEQWVDKQRLNRAEFSQKGYEAYLWEQKAPLTGGVTITLPTLSADPPLDTRPNPVPPKGMVGGKLGFDRFYKLDLKHETLNQFKR